MKGETNQGTEVQLEHTKLEQEEEAALATIERKFKQRSTRGWTKNKHSCDSPCKTTPRRMQRRLSACLRSVVVRTSKNEQRSNATEAVGTGRSKAQPDASRTGASACDGSAPSGSTSRQTTRASTSRASSRGTRTHARSTSTCARNGDAASID